MKREWVVGFLIDEDREWVILIRKLRPAWMAGMLNGVGGKIEPGEVAADAMSREFAEETGVYVRPSEWHEFVRLHAVTTEDFRGDITVDGGVIHFFRAFAPKRTLQSVRTVTSECVVQRRVSLVDLDDPVPNLRWLIPLAAHRSDEYETIAVFERSTTLRVPT